MFIDLFKNNGVPYLRLVESRRKTTKHGKLTSVKVPIFNIGPLSKFDDGNPDYVKRLRQSFKDGTPIIDSLLPYVNPAPRSISLTFVDGDPACFAHPKLFSDALLGALFKDLGLSKLFASIKASRHIQFDLVNFVRLITFGRIINPASKAATIRQNDDYLYPLLDPGFNKDNVYDMLDIVYENRQRIFRTINKKLVNKQLRDTSVIFYDVTNLYFETDQPDEDTEDEDGNVVKGLRKMGVSKEQRKQPIVQMGLFMDRNGIPIGVEEFPGNTLDHMTMKPAVENIIDQMNYNRFIFVSDRGIANYKNCLHLLQDGNGYLVSKSIKKASKKDKEWILDQEGYHKQYNKDGEITFKYKSQIVKRTAKDHEGIQRTFQEKVLVYWSRDYYKRNLAENQSFLKFLDKLKENPDNFRITAAQSKTMKQFMKKDVVNQKTGEVLESKDLLPMVDWDKVEEWKKYMGYYQIVTSEMETDDLEIISIYHELSQIEDRFRTMKGTLDSRPIYCWSHEHIAGHLVLCAVSLIMMCLVQKKIKEKEGDGVQKEEGLWSAGLSGERLQKALNKWMVEEFPQNYYRFCNMNDADLLKVLEAFDIHIACKLYTTGELREIRRSIHLW